MELYSILTVLKEILLNNTVVWPIMLHVKLRDSLSSHWLLC
jgi:hypothetical protein